MQQFGLSGGELQKAYFYKVITKDSDVIFLDESTSKIKRVFNK